MVAYSRFQSCCLFSHQKGKDCVLENMLHVRNVCCVLPPNLQLFFGYYFFSENNQTTLWSCMSVATTSDKYGIKYFRMNYTNNGILTTNTLHLTLRRHLKLRTEANNCMQIDHAWPEVGIQESDVDSTLIKPIFLNTYESRVTSNSFAARPLRPEPWTLSENYIILTANRIKITWIVLTKYNNNHNDNAIL